MPCCQVCLHKMFHIGYLSIVVHFCLLFKDVEGVFLSFFGSYVNFQRYSFPGYLLLVGQKSSTWLKTYISAFHFLLLPTLGLHFPQNIFYTLSAQMPMPELTSLINVNTSSLYKTIVTKKPPDQQH